MNRNPLSSFVLKSVICLSVALALFAPSGYAQTDALSFSKNWFVTGDVAFASVSLRSSGNANGLATGTINMTGVPCSDGVTPVSATGTCPEGTVPADIVAALLYWETEETSLAPAAMNGFFDSKLVNGVQTPNPIVGKVIGDPNNKPCWSSGGTTGNPNGAGRAYRVDVRKFLKSQNNTLLANGPHTVTLIESGGNGNGNTFLTNGATLVVVWRMVVPGQPLLPKFPLRSIVAYEGAATVGKNLPPLFQTIGGFYDARVTASNQTSLTPIIGNGQPDFHSTLTINGANPATINKFDKFTGTAPQSTGSQGRWDSPTFNFDLVSRSGSYSTQLST